MFLPAVAGLYAYNMGCLVTSMFNSLPMKISHQTVECNIKYTYTFIPAGGARAKTTSSGGIAAESSNLQDVIWRTGE